MQRGVAEPQSNGADFWLLPSSFFQGHHDLAPNLRVFQPEIRAKHAQERGRERLCRDSGKCERCLKHSKNFTGCDPCIQTLIRGYTEKSRVDGNKDSLCQMESGQQAHLCGRGQEKSRLRLTLQRENRPPSLLPVCLRGKTHH